jgi:hypothetical protein
MEKDEQGGKCGSICDLEGDVKMTNENSTDKQKSRANIIQTVQTPLGFFALVVLVVEVIFGITANFSQG